MLLRTVSGLLGLAVLLIAIWAGLFWVFALTLLAAIVGIREFYRLFPPSPAPPEPADSEAYFPEADGGGPGLYLSNTSASEDPNPAHATEPGSHGSNPQAGYEAGAAGNISDVVTASHQSSAPAESPATEMGASPSAGGRSGSPPEASGAPHKTPLPTLLGAAWVAAFVIAGAGASGVFQFWGISLGILAVGCFVAVLWLIAFYRGVGWPAASAYLLFGPIYVGFLLAHVMLLAQVGEVFFKLDPLYFDPEAGPTVYEVGRNWLMFALLVNFATDSGAYLVGRAIGRHPMAPATSPNKTWEGAAGGFACAIIAAFLLDKILDLGLGATVWDGAWTAVNWQPLLIGATVGVGSQFGDLLESRLKRISQVKDSGALLPGHGGLLDRLDSLLITFPTVYYLLVAVLRL